jgi:putative transposase
MTALRRVERPCLGRPAEPSAGALDSHSVKTATPGREVGFDGNNKIKGRKRQRLVDTLGLIVDELAGPYRREGGPGSTYSPFLFHGLWK